MLAPGRGLRGAALSEMARQRAAAAGRWRRGSARSRSAPARSPPRPSGGRCGSTAPGLGELARRMAVGPVAHPGDGPAVHRHRGRAAALPRPAGARAGARPRAPRGALRSRDAGAQQAACRATAGTTRGSARWKLAMAEHGAAIAEARERTVAALDERLAGAPDDQFARAALALEGWDGADLAAELRTNRARDAAAGPRHRRAAPAGPRRRPSRQAHAGGALLDRGAEGAAARPHPRSRRSRGRAARRAAHPAARRSRGASRSQAPRALFARLAGRGQVWMTATEAALFEGIGAASRFHVEPGQIAPV